MEDTQIAGTLCAELAERIGAERFDVWFGPPTRLCVEARRLTVRAASTFERDCLRNQFGDDIRACWERIVGCTMPVEFDVDAAPAPPRETAGQQATSHEELPTPQTELRAVALRQSTEPTHEKSNASRGGHGPSLASFVVGGSNEYAFAAAEFAVRGRQQLSPVLLWGPTGVGKTHLLRAAVREFRRYQPCGAAVYLSAEQFTTNFVEAIRGGGLPSFRQKCRGAQLLAVDDIQFFVGKRRTLEEFQHTIDFLLRNGRQLMLGSDRCVAELYAMGPEIASRLSGGLVCEIAPPEFATRMEIVRRLCREMKIEIDDLMLRSIAAQISAGARELRGALLRLQALSHAHEKPITRDLVDRTLAELARNSTRPVRLDDVQKAVCEVFGVEPSDLRSERRGRSVSEPRMLAMWLARKFTRAAWSEIGQYFGRRSHSTVISAHHRVEKLISRQGEVGLHDRPCQVEEAIRKLEAALRTA